MAPEAAADQGQVPSVSRKKWFGLGFGLSLLALGIVLGVYYGEHRDSTDLPKNGSPSGVGTLSVKDDASSPVIRPTPLEKVDTSQIGSGATVDQVADVVQSNPDATAAIDAIDKASQQAELTFNAGSPMNPASKILAGAALPDLASMAETQGNAELQEFVDKMAERTAQSTQLEAALAGFQKAVVRKETCTPKDAKGLTEAVAARCLYIKLAPGTQYNLTKVAINITYPVAIVGDPFSRPMLDGRKTPRLFNVLPGGFLDLQYVRLIRGSVRSFLDGNYAVAIGGGALIYPGAGGNFLGVVFLNPVETWLARDIKGMLAIGGQVLNLGGLVTFTGCHFFNMAPTAVRVATVVGGDILTAAGVTIESGCTHTQAGGVVVGIGIVGLFSAVLGGVHISSGVAYNRNLGAQFGSGAGIQTSVLGGVGIYSGVAYNTQGGLFAMFGCSVKQWLGAGVVINSGVAQSLTFGCNIFCGVGPFQGVGAGTSHSSGSNYNLNTGMAFIAASGAQNFMGAGHSSYVGCTFSRTFGQIAAYGLGGTICADTGDLEVIASPKAVVAGIAATAMLSLQYFMAAGVMVIIRSPAMRLAALYWRAGQGIGAYVAAGNLTIIRCRDTFRGFLGYAHTLSGKRQVKYFCNGRPYTEVKKDPTILKPARFNAFTPSPKPWNPTKAPKMRALQAAAAPEANATAAVTTVVRAANIFQQSIEMYDGPSAACFDGVTVTDTKGGSLPAPGTLVKSLMAGTAAKDIFTGGTTDCDSPFMGSDYKLDACTIKDSTLTGCAAPGYLGLSTQDAEVCSTEGTCLLPQGLATDAAYAALAAPEADDAADRRRRYQRLLQQQPALDERVQLGTITVLRADVMATCRVRGQCKDTVALQNAMGEYLNLGAGAKLSVSVDGLDPLVARHLGMDPEAEAAAATTEDGCDAVVQYNVYCTTKDPVLAAQFKAAMLEFNKHATNENFTAALKTNPAYASLCTIAGLVSFDFSVPLANAAANIVGDTTANAITPAVAVLDESGLGINKMQPGQWVSVKMTKFPTDSPAVVKLVDPTGATAASVASFTPTSEAAEVVSWQVPADLKPGFYIFSASPASNLGIKAMSSIIKVEGAGSGSGSTAGVFGRRRRA